MSTSRRVVITGLGTVSALGFNENELWAQMIARQTGIRTIKHLDTSELKTTVGGVIDRDAFKDALLAIRLRYTDLTVDSAILASDQALRQAGLIVADTPPEPQPIATLFGTGIGSVESYYKSVCSYIEKGTKGIRPTTVPRCMANAICSQIAIRYRLTGPNYVVTAACTSSTTAIGIAFRMIKDGYIDKALCGGADTIFDPMTLAAWDRLGMMSRDPAPIRACRPFDRDRAGCVVGEGAAALVLETLESAQARGATIRAELCGYGESSDARHITAPDAEGQARAIRDALASAGIAADALGMISAHGTATVINDLTECQSAKMALGTAVSTIPIAAQKSYFGHLLGGSGAIETLATVLSLETGIIPANLNLETPDEATAGLCLVGNTSTPLQRPYALKSSFGVGGNNGVLVLRRYSC
ncbi:MAG TPA: beta-ketoacyl-[acyl-carrier-protein] synthase II [Verrucomicrobia bacterium]|nr:beta-ketoacyl-[acyl-carrier-protein] synthase II [Verrucomicrobiota bacterium]